MGQRQKKLKKQLQSLFKQKGLQIIIECNLKVVNYLDVIFNLNDGSYRPYRKPNDGTHYIHIQLDHSPSITKQLPRSIEKRLSQLSSSKDILYETTPYYEQCLASWGYNEKLTYQQQGENNENNKNIGKNRKRNIIWFNPPYSKSLKTNIGKYFFRLHNKHFPPGHNLYKILKKNTLKLSYSRMPYLKAKIDGHNKNILENTPPSKTKLCNCLKKENWPMRGACLTENVLYYARISCDNETYKPRLYKGICETTFKKRYVNHKKSFYAENNRNDTKLSTEYWRLANQKLHPRISWSIKGNYKSYNSNSKRCSLCLYEK